MMNQRSPTAALDDVLVALADPTRRAIFERLADGPMSVGALADGLPVSRPAVSQHLKTLKDAGLVIDRAAGTRRYYELSPAGLASLQRWLDRFWDRALAAFKEAAEAAEKEWGTRVDLEHRKLEAYGEAAEAMRGVFESESG